MAKKKKEKAEAEAASGKLKRKLYEKELHKLQVELCHLQEWVKAEGQGVIIAFEGRDAAGKGGTIKALTERVSPRVFRVVALPAPSDREKTQMYMQRYMEHFPAAGEIVIFDRSWYNRAGVEHVMGFVDDKRYERFLELLPGDREIHHRSRHHADQDLARGRNGRAGAPLCRPRRGSAAAMEAEPDGRRIVLPLVRLFARARRDAESDRQQARAVGHRALRRQAPGAAQLHLAHPAHHSVQENQDAKVKLPSRSDKGAYDDQATLKGRRFVAERY